MKKTTLRKGRRAFRAEETPPELMAELLAADYSHLPHLHLLQLSDGIRD